MESIIIERVQKISIHPNITYGLPYQYNIAIITLKQILTLHSKHIKPVCLPKNLFQPSIAVGSHAFAVGWGRDLTGHFTRKQKHVAMRIRDNEICNSVYKKELTNNNLTSSFFCAGGEKHGTACSRDDPLYFKIENRWHLIGLSALGKNYRNKTCNDKYPFAYEDVSQYYKWIRMQLDV
jgi:secreted trypsin-like serine protease